MMGKSPKMAILGLKKCLFFFAQSSAKKGHILNLHPLKDLCAKIWRWVIFFRTLFFFMFFVPRYLTENRWTQTWSLMNFGDFIVRQFVTSTSEVKKKCIFEERKTKMLERPSNVETLGCEIPRKISSSDPHQYVHVPYTYRTRTVRANGISKYSYGRMVVTFVIRNCP